MDANRAFYRGCALMMCPHCGSPLDDAGICQRCGDFSATAPLTGWRPDPTARHEGRYYVAGRPTGRVRNGRAEAIDPGGGRMLPGFVDLPAPVRWSLRSTWLGTGMATVVVVALAVVVELLLMSHRTSPSPDGGYLAALKDAGLTGQFNSDANALAHGRAVCRQLDDGGPQQGLPADKVAVDSFCPKFAEGFHVLETATVPGTFVLTDTMPNLMISAIASDGATCAGTGGYSDIGPGTQVIVKNGKGDVLATATLGEGHGDGVACTFSFSFPVTEGQDRYVVSVGHRGEFSYTFTQLQGQGVGIRLGH